ncbi:MAG: serine hydrolase domain-containing protein [Bacteroidota bacterium]
MNKILFASCLLIGFNLQILAQRPSTVLKITEPELAGFSDVAIHRIDSLLQQYTNKHLIGGATALVAKDGKVVYYKAVGKRNFNNQPMERTDIFRIASQTKAITAVAVMMLYEQGKFLLDDPISKFIPSFANPVVIDSFIASDSSFTTRPAKREITIRDLLTHTSGIHYSQIGNKTFNAIYSKSGITSGIGVKGHILGEDIIKLGKLPLAHHPGEKFTYGLNSDVLGYLVEVASGQTLDKFFKSKIFDPLGMKDTYFFLPKEKQQRLTVLYGEDEAKLVVKKEATFPLNGDWITDYPNTNGTYFSGGGGLSSTAYDYSLFMQMMLNKGSYNGHRLLSPSTVEMMTMNQTAQFGLPDANLGLGFGISTLKEKAKLGMSPGSYSWGGMFSSSYWIDPEKNIVAQLFINQLPMSHGAIHDKFKALVYAALK